MFSRMMKTLWMGGLAVAISAQLLAGEANRGPLDPKGQIHIPIGIANTLDALKTFVEAEGNFSPGCASYGIYFWVYDPETRKLTAPTMDGVTCEHGLAEGGYLIPWSAWQAGQVSVKTEVCEVICKQNQQEQSTPPLVATARMHLLYSGEGTKKLSVYAALRSLGPSGWPVKKLDVSPDGDALLVDNQPALIASSKPSAAGVGPTDTVGDLAIGGKLPAEKNAVSEAGNCSGALRFDLTLAPKAPVTLNFICPVLPGRTAVRHKWDGKSKWAQLDEAVPNTKDGGIPQPAMGLEYYRNLKADALFDDARDYWRDLAGRVKLKLPDKRWAECFAAITGHAALCMNEGAPDVAVVNYNVFNRDGVYVANILQKSGHPELARQAISYFIGYPFNGRVDPEADNPGQILWIMGQHWLFARDTAWLKEVYSSAKQIVKMIEYYRTTPEPHWVNSKRLTFGEALPPEHRQQLKPGACDGFNPNYTEAFDIAGVRAAVLLAEAMTEEAAEKDAAHDAQAWMKLAVELFGKYEQRFGAQLGKGYGSYSVLWPCQLYPYSSGKAYEQFKGIGAQAPKSWRYFPLATAHQGLLAGNRDAGYGTLEKHLQDPQMQGWYAFDEGGKSGSGGWQHVRTTWNGDVAMPHGWAIAEVHLLLRDSLLFEDGQRLVLLGGVPPDWFTRPEGISIENMPTHFGAMSLNYKPSDTGATLTLSGKAAPTDGFTLRLPASIKATAKSGDTVLARAENGDIAIPAKSKEVVLEFAK
ncbi:MAG TPA: hypothetical protein VGP72_10915 [Planctomycetota bacterium]|jgi:hypothetical protein